MSLDREKYLGSLAHFLREEEKKKAEIKKLADDFVKSLGLSHYLPELALSDLSAEPEVEEILDAPACNLRKRNKEKKDDNDYSPSSDESDYEELEKGHKSKKIKRCKKKYESRTEYARTRPRIGGRFLAKDQAEVSRAPQTTIEEKVDAAPYPVPARSEVYSALKTIGFFVRSKEWMSKLTSLCEVKLRSLNK